MSSRLSNLRINNWIVTSVVPFNALAKGEESDAELPTRLTRSRRIYIRYNFQLKVLEVLCNLKQEQCLLCTETLIQRFVEDPSVSDSVTVVFASPIRREERVSDVTDYLCSSEYVQLLSMRKMINLPQKEYQEYISTEHRLRLKS
ncbi:hypothetical protein GcM3_186054 [Golovinomyces cichoracearum]|uniref:Uncharacterized protein n=1 Tax=Golovinomyces cichoracearum TaxID=62708 RepID=A0A420HJN7_9PEZI|nr:hypothetical protein GcM3_186054 [Golovinomyces cichoracearum]